MAQINITVEALVDFAELKEDDQDCFDDIVGEHTFFIAQDCSVDAMRSEIRGRSWATKSELDVMKEFDVRRMWVIEKAKDEFHETPIKVLDDFLIEEEIVSEDLSEHGVVWVNNLYKEAEARGLNPKSVEPKTWAEAHALGMSPSAAIDSLCE